MPDTIDEDDEIPDTLSDPPPVPPAVHARMKPRHSVAIAVSLAAAFLVVAVLGVYLFVFRYEPVARRHIPGNANLALRVEFARALLFRPVRDRLWPLVTGGPSGSSKPSRIERIRDATGVDLATDPREIIVASTDGSAWLVILGGHFTKGHFVHGLEKVAREEGWSNAHVEGELLLGPSGVAVGQADDGAIVFGSNAAIANAALPASDEYKRLDLADDAAVTFAITREAWGGASGALQQLLQHAPVLGHIERANGKLVLGDAPVVSMRVEARAGTSATELAKDLDVTVGEARILTMLFPDVAGEKSVLSSVKITPGQDGTHVDVTAPWPIDGLDKGLSRIATLLRLLAG